VKKGSVSTVNVKTRSFAEQKAKKKNMKEQQILIHFFKN
jgi:hypothetical protein